MRRQCTLYTISMREPDDYDSTTEIQVMVGDNGKVIAATELGDDMIDEDFGAVLHMLALDGDFTITHRFWMNMEDHEEDH